MALLKNKRYVHSDFDIDLSKNDTTKDLVKLTEAEAIKNSIRNILFTNKGERLFNPEFGSDLKMYIYEQVTMIKAEEIRMNIQNQLRMFEDRIVNLSVEVLAIPQRNTFHINITFKYTITEEIIDLTFNIEAGK